MKKSDQGLAKFIQNLARQAGQILIKKFGHVSIIRTKEHASDVVTQADLAVNKFIIAKIKRAFPDHGIISEETGQDHRTAEYVWIIDPLDGTQNFARQTPICGSMIALMKNNVLTQAAIYELSCRTLIYAARGGGAWRDGKRIICSQVTKLNHSYGCHNVTLGKRSLATWRAFIQAAKTQLLWINQLGAAATTISYLADGRRDWYVSTGGGGLWDYAPAALILSEAGCKVTNLKGQPWSLADREILAANPVLHKKLLKIIRG